MELCTSSLWPGPCFYHLDGKHHSGYQWWGINVNEVRTLAFSPSLPLPPSLLFLSSPSWCLSLPFLSFRAALVPQDRPGASSGTCSPGPQCSRALTCKQVCGHVCGHYAMPCHLRISRVAWIQRHRSWSIVVVWLMVVVVRRK